MIIRGLAAALLLCGLVASPAQAAAPALCTDSHPTGSVTSTTSGTTHVLTVRLTYSTAQVAATKACGPYLKFQALIENYNVSDDAYAVTATDFSPAVKNKSLKPGTFSPGLAGIFTGSLTARTYVTVLTWTGGADGVPFSFYIQVGRGPSGPFQANFCRTIPNPCYVSDAYNATGGTVGGGDFGF